MVKKQKSVNESHSNNSADQSERWYRMVLDSANDAVLVYSRTSEGKLNKFVDVNKAACDLYGYSREEFLGISPIDISASKNVGYYRKQQEQSTFGQKLVVESVHLTKDGREIPVEISRSLFEIDGRHVVVSVVRDISKRKRKLAQLEDARIGLEQRVAERTAQLAASGERITDLISTMHNAVCVYRAVNNANDFVFSEFNHAAEIMEGCSRQEVIGKNLTEVSPRVKESGLIEALRRVYKTGKPEHYPPSIYKDPRGGPDTWREAWLYKLNSGEIVAEYNDATERMRAEGAYQTLVENTLQGLLILQDERIVFANQALVQMSGYTMDELLGLSPEAVRDLVHPDDQGFVFRRAQERLDGKSVPPQYEFCFVRKDGELRWVEQYASVIEYGGRPAAQATYIDITERKKAEESLRTEKEFSDKILNAGQDTVFVFDPASGKALRWNESFAKKSGYSNEQIAEMKAPDSWYSKQDIEKASIYINQIMQGNVPSPIELSLIAKDGTLVPTEYVATVIKGDEGEPLSVIAVGRDITERKLAEQELRTSQERIRAILNASPDVIHLIDINGIILASNKSFAERVGLEIDDVIGTSVFDYGTPESAHRRKIAIDKVFSTGKPVQLEDEGLTGTYESYIHPVFNPAGEILAVAVYARDITERKQAEQELLDSEAKFKTISHGSLQGIVITKDQTIAYANPAFEALFGYTMEELNAFNSQQRIERTYVDDRERIAKYHQERFEGKDVPKSIEYRIVRKDETVRWVESRSSMIEYLGGQAILSVCVDTTERKQAEEEIRKLGSAVDQSIDGIAMSDLEPKLTFVNQAFAGMHGYTVEEMMGMKVENIHSKEQRQEFAGRVGQIQQEGSWAGEIGHVRKDGSIFPTFMTTTLIRDEKGDPTGIMIFARDITGLKQAEEEIKKLGSAVDQSIDGIAINDRTHKIVYANETYAAMHGYSPQELKELSFRDLIPGDGGDIWPAIRQSVTTKDSWSGEIDHLKKDGTTFPSYISITKLKDDDGKQIGVLSICRDITERKQAEAKLKDYSENLEQLVKERAAELADSEEKFRLIVNSTNDAIHVSQRLEDGTAKMMEVNQTLCDMLGYTREELLNMLPVDLASAHGVDMSRMIKHRLEKEKYIVYETEFLSKTGKKIPVEIGVRVFNYKGVRTIVSVIRNITERKESQRKLDDVQQKMLRSEKLAAIGQMASGIAHELRNPLAIVNNAAYYIKLKMGGADETLDKHLAIMEKEIFRSSSIIAGLLDFARTREPQLRAIGLNEFASRVIYGLSIPHEMTLIFEAAPGEINLSVDTEQIKRVLINMVNNAVNAMPKGGELSIAVKAGKDHAEIHITDTGVGISHGNLRKIFDPLFTTRSAEGGTGIGLSICKSIIKAHRGDIKVKSTVGKGTTFTIRLPIS